MFIFLCACVCCMFPKGFLVISYLCFSNPPIELKVYLYIEKQSQGFCKLKQRGSQSCRVLRKSPPFTDLCFTLWTPVQRRHKVNEISHLSSSGDSLMQKRSVSASRWKFISCLLDRVYVWKVTTLLNSKRAAQTRSWPFS